MTRISLIETAHQIVRDYLHAGDIAIDATLGNGHDTVFLAHCVGDTGRVFGFDIQAKALYNTRQRLRPLGLEDRVILFQICHADMSTHIPPIFQGRIRAVMFNLGYLPSADKAVITKTPTTIAALGRCCRLLAEEAVITILAYPGHAGGDEETRQVTDWCGRLDTQRFKVEVIRSHHDQPTAPKLFVIRKQVNLL